MAATRSTGAPWEALRTIGLRLQRIRMARDKSLRVTAELSGMSKDTLHRIEHGKRDLTLFESVALASALGIPAEKLLMLPISVTGEGRTERQAET